MKPYVTIFAQFVTFGLWVHNRTPSTELSFKMEDQFEGTQLRIIDHKLQKHEESE